MNALLCEFEDCGLAVPVRENAGWVSVAFDAWPEPDGQWEHERYFCSMVHATAFSEQRLRDLAEIETEVAAMEDAG